VVAVVAVVAVVVIVTMVSVGFGQIKNLIFLWIVMERQ